MANSSRRKGLVLVLSSLLVFAAVMAGPAEAKKKKKPPKPAGCAAFTPIEPNSPSGETAEVLETPIVKVTDAATAEKPIVIEYEHGPALWDTLSQEPIIEDTVFFNFQVETTQAAPGIHIFQEWAAHPPSDMDLYLYDGATGEQLAVSGSANAFPMPVSQVPGQGTGAWGLESIPGFAVTNCAGYTVESRAFTTAGESMTLTVWLGEAAAQ
jgi:hypothetical protein